MADHLGTYLGLPSAFHRGKGKDFKSLMDKVWSTLQGWKRNLFSVGGKEVLIKSVVQAIPMYAMGCFRLPKGILTKINALCAKFWWGSTDQKHKIHWSSWKKYVNLRKWEV